MALDLDLGSCPGCGARLGVPVDLAVDVVTDNRGVKMAGAAMPPAATPYLK